MTRPRTSFPQFGLDFEFEAAGTTVVLHGELDALSVPAFAGALTAIAERGGPRVTIDLTELRFCNIGGLRAMAELAARMHAVDGRVEIVAPSILFRMLEIDDLRSLFVIHDADPTERPGSFIDLTDVNRAPRTSRPRTGAWHRLPAA